MLNGSMLGWISDAYVSWISYSWPLIVQGVAAFPRGWDISLGAFWRVPHAWATTTRPPILAHAHTHTHSHLTCVAPHSTPDKCLRTEMYFYFFRQTPHSSGKQYEANSRRRMSSKKFGHRNQLSNDQTAAIQRNAAWSRMRLTVPWISDGLVKGVEKDHSS